MDHKIHTNSSPKGMYERGRSTHGEMVNIISRCCLVQRVVSNSLQSHGLQPTKLLCPWDSPGKNTGGGCHFFLQISLTLGLKPYLLHWQVESLPLSQLGSPGLNIYLHVMLDHGKSKRVPEKTPISALLTMQKPLTVWITINCGKF